MNYTREARECKQQMYGGYVEMCKYLGENPVPYVSMTYEMYDDVKLRNRVKRKEFKKKNVII